MTHVPSIFLFLPTYYGNFSSICFECSCILVDLYSLNLVAGWHVSTDKFWSSHVYKTSEKLRIIQA